MAGHFPFRKVYIEITNRCNLRCSFCPQTLRPARHMTPAEFAHVLDELRNLTGYICLHVKGEPLAHPELAGLLALAHERGFQVNLTTNGTLLAARGELLLGKNAPRQVSVSLHSFDANTAADLSPKASALLSSTGTGRVPGSDPEMPPAMARYLSEVTAFARAYTAQTPGYFSYRLWNLIDEKNAALSAQVPANARILRFLEESYHLTQPIAQAPDRYTGNAIAVRTYVNFDRRFEWPSLTGRDYGEYGSCYGLRRQLAILSDGTVIPCCLDGEGAAALGNIFTQPLKEILASPAAVRIREGFMHSEITHPLCRRCEYRTRFGHDAARGRQTSLPQ